MKPPRQFTVSITMIRFSGLLCTIVVCLLSAAGGATDAVLAGGPRTEVIVTLASAPSAGLAGARLEARRAAIDREQAQFARSLHLAVPEATIRWRYRLVLNAAAVMLPQGALPRLQALSGVRSVDVGASYPAAAVSSSAGAASSSAWQTGLPNQGAGMKIGIIDDGVDQTHPYFNPAGYTMPAGFPRGQVAYTTAKVIVARAFAPAKTTWKHARKPFDPEQSGHATHVAGIAAGNAATPSSSGFRSGVAPRAYIGNYKALSVPTDANVGLDGNAAELVAAIEAAVADGMDVINLSIGEPEVAPSRDLVALALDGAAAAGVVPVVAAGNDFDDFGPGSLSSPGTAKDAITVAAVTIPTASGSSLASFSAAGPTALSLRLKPDISAPGVAIVSSVPRGRWEALSGTSMASPQIAGVSALLKERHPTWSVATLKAALIGSGSPVQVDGTPAPPTRGGGGLAVPVRADVPLILASPASVSLGLVRPGSSVPATVTLADAGGGAGAWNVSVEAISAVVGAQLSIAPTVTIPGNLDFAAVIDATAAEGELTGFVRLTRGTDIRRVPFWLRVERPGLLAATTSALSAPGLYSGDTRGRPALASRYRYPEVPVGGIVAAVLDGPEQLFRVTLTKPVANFGVVIVRRGLGARVEPRIVMSADENRLTGYPALPVNLNPYLAVFGSRVLVSAAVRPVPGIYDIVFDSPTAAGAGSFSFRYWVDDTTPPSLVLPQPRVKRGTPVIVNVADAGAGVDPATVTATIDGAKRAAPLRAGALRISTNGLRPGRYALRVQVSDYQESRNMENVPPILPNTRVLRKTIVIR